jgi:carbamoyltransferase
MTTIIGISAFYHDAAACLVVDGEIIAAAQEERFTRIKHDQSFPSQAIAFCLEFANIQAADIDHVVFYDKPLLKFNRLMQTYLAFAPKGYASFATALPIWLKDKLFQKKRVTSALENLLGSDVDWKSKLLFSEHHLSHAASAFFPSPFEEAAILTMDGVGEWTTTSLAIGTGSTIEVFKEIQFPHSLGLLYSAITYYTGFKVNSGEYKVMGLAPYGQPKYADLIREHLIQISEDGSFRLNMEYFDYCTGFTMTNNRFDALFGGPRRSEESALTQKEMDLAASIQLITEEVVIKLARNVRKTTGMKNLCLAGGVALNCVANGKLLKRGIFENIWIQPAAGDAGGSIGAALAVYHLMLNGPRKLSSTQQDGMKGGFLGPEYEQKDIETRLRAAGARFTSPSYEDVIALTAQALCEGKAVGWHQGRMEFGPRSLGGRSIIADPRSPSVQKLLNLKVKYRESFRPFAPSVLRQDVAQWFELDCDSPYMLLVAGVHASRHLAVQASDEDLFGIDKLNIPRSSIPAVTHVDYSARVQTVHETTNKKYFDLLTAFKALTGCPVLVNTSFNVRGEPIVSSPEDAFRCLMGTEIEFLVVGNSIMRKEDQDIALKLDYKNAYVLD